jgi:proteasome lid subunit RPN8/RPN11
MTEHQERRIEREVFRIMRHKIKGKNSDVELRCWQMVTIAKSIYKRFKVTPYKIRLKHLLWYMDEELIWILSSHTAYRYYITIKSFCQCIDKWGHWEGKIKKVSPLNLKGS